MPFLTSGGTPHNLEAVSNISSMSMLGVNLGSDHLLDMDPNCCQAMAPRANLHGSMQRTSPHEAVLMWGCGGARLALHSLANQNVSM